MSKIVIEIKNEPEKDDILIFDGKDWKCISKNVLLQEVKKEIFLLKEDVKILSQDSSEIVSEIKKLKGED